MWEGGRVVCDEVQLRVVKECYTPALSCPRSGPGIASWKIFLAVTSRFSKNSMVAAFQHDGIIPLFGVTEAGKFESGNECCV